MELAQGDRHAAALDELVSLELHAGAMNWSEVALLAGIGQALYGVVYEDDRVALQRTLVALVVRAESLGSPSLTALALSLRAVGAGGLGDSDGLLTDAGRAVALVADESLPALDRCTVLVICGAAYNSLSLWELAQELYDEAGALAPLCERPVQDAALAVNRILVHIEWAGALFELDDETEALLQIGYAAAAVETASATPRRRHPVAARRPRLRRRARARPGCLRPPRRPGRRRGRPAGPGEWAPHAARRR